MEQLKPKVKLYPFYINLARAPMLSDGEIWRPLPDEEYRPYILWAGMWWEKRKTNHPKEVYHQVESGQGEVHGHNNNLCVLSRR